MSECKRCGKVLNDEERFCGRCGLPADNTPSPLRASGPFAVPADKNRLLFILMGVLFGPFGVHNFIIGNTGKGVAQLLITVLSLGVLAFVSGIWAIVEICTVTTNANGEPLVFNF